MRREMRIVHVYTRIHVSAPMRADAHTQRHADLCRTRVIPELGVADEIPERIHGRCKARYRSRLVSRRRCPLMREKIVKSRYIGFFCALPPSPRALYALNCFILLYYSSAFFQLRRLINPFDRVSSMRIL